MPVDAAPDVCAFMRGPNVLVVVPLSPEAPPDVEVAGEWRDVLEQRFPVPCLRETGDVMCYAPPERAWILGID